MEQTLLTERGVEDPRAEGKHLRVGPQQPHERIQSDEDGETGTGRAARVGEVHADDPRAEAMREDSRGSAESGADVEDRHAGADPGSARQGFDGLESAVVVLVPLPEILGGERAGARVPTRGLEHLRLIDGVAIVEVDHRATGLTHEQRVYGRVALKSPGAYGRRSRFHPSPRRTGEP